MEKLYALENRNGDGMLCSNERASNEVMTWIELNVLKIQFLVLPVGAQRGDWGRARSTDCDQMNSTGTVKKELFFLFEVCGLSAHLNQTGTNETLLSEV